MPNSREVLAKRLVHARLAKLMKKTNIKKCSVKCIDLTSEQINEATVNALEFWEKENVRDEVLKLNFLGQLKLTTVRNSIADSETKNNLTDDPQFCDHENHQRITHPRTM